MTNQERLQANNEAIENIQQALASKMIMPAADYATIEDVENAVADKATISYVDTKVADLVNSAPETLDTLGEVATAIQNNSSVVDALNSAIGNKVDKVSGKGLSSNDYTTEEKNKLSGLSNYNDTGLRGLINNKADKSAIPTKVSQLTNDSNYLTSIPSEYVTETELNNKGYATTSQLANKVDKVDGKVLSTNDYTTAEKTKLAGLSNYDDTAIKSQINKIPTKTSQLTNDSGFLTEHQDLSGYARVTEIPTKVSELENDKNYLTEIELTQEQLDEIADAVVEAQKVEFVESVEQCTDTSKQYVLPDGYIYTYSKKTVNVTHNANDGTGVLNVRPTASSGSTKDDNTTKNGLFTTAPIKIDNSWNSCVVTISGLEKIVPTFYAPLYVYYFTPEGVYIAYLSNQTLNMTTSADVEMPLPVSVDIANASNSAINHWKKASYVRVCVGVKSSAITNADVENLVINFEKLNTVEEKYGWYSTGHMYNKDEYSQAIEQNASKIEILQTDVATLKEAVKTTPSQSGAVWYAVGDSITKGYGVGADKCWVKYVLDYNGYDKEKSKNLGISGLGFAKSDPNYNKTARMVVDENDFTKVDLVTIAIGINDWKEPFSIDTVKSEMGYCFEKILTDNPYCKIIFIVPFNIWLKGSANTNWALGYSGSDVTGGTLQNFIDAQKSVCEQYGIQIIDMTNNSVINKVNIETVLYDKIHPNAECHIALGRELARRITYA